MTTKPSTKSPKNVKKSRKSAVLSRKSQSTSVKNVEKHKKNSDETRRKTRAGRNEDGTFADGNTISVGNTGGRPPEELSVRYQMKLRVAKDPKLVQDAIDSLVKVLKDPDHPKWDSALDKFIKLNGNYDPSENKTELSGVIQAPRRSALDDLTVEELRKLKALKEAE